MNQMTSAFVDKGIKPLPQQHQIWRWVKDNKEHSTREICDALKLKQTTAGALLTQMCDRNMMERKEITKFGRLTTVFTCPADMHVYASRPFLKEVADRRKALHPTKRGAKSKQAVKSGPVTVVTQRPSLAAPIIHVSTETGLRLAPMVIDRLSDWTLNDLRRLHKTLNAMFAPA